MASRAGYELGLRQDQELVNGDGTSAFGSVSGLLADLGADVVLVEPPNGSRARGIAPFVDDQPGPERSYRHLYFNANKRSIVLDLTTLDDRARLLDLVGSSDLLLETAAPGTLGAIGLDHDVLRARNPSLIQVSLTPLLLFIKRPLDLLHLELQAERLVVSSDH